MLTSLQRDQQISMFLALSEAETLAEAWQTCELGTAMVQVCGAMLGLDGWPTAQEILLVLCECAETAFCYLPKSETRPQECVRVSRLWAEGKATVEEVATAVRAAVGTTGPIARGSPSNAASELRGAAMWAATAAYDIAKATLHAADADKFAASGDAERACLYSYFFWCVANGVIHFSANAAGDAAAFQNKNLAHLVRSRLHPKGMETYRRVTPTSDDEALADSRLREAVRAYKQNPSKSISKCSP